MEAFVVPGVSDSCKLGELLVYLELITEETLDEVIQLAVQINLPLGRALILSNKLDEHELRSVLQLQHLLRAKTVKLEESREIFARVRRNRTTIATELDALGKCKHSTDFESRSKLGTFLVDAQLVTEEQVSEAQKLSFDAGTPIGRMLALSGVITFNTLARAVDLQVMVREGKIAYAAAVNALCAEGLRDLPVEENIKHHGLVHGRRKVRLGELMMLAGLLTENDLLNVIELGLSKPAPLGEILVELGLVTRDMLALALSLQEQVEAGEIDVRAAAQNLQHASGRVSGLQEKCSGIDEPETVRLGELLKQSGLVDDGDIKEAVDLSNRYPTMLGKMLVVTGSIDEGTLLAALRCQYLVRNHLVGVSEAVRALQYAQRHRLSLDDALEDLGNTQKVNVE